VKHVYPLARQTDLPRAAVVQHLVQAFRARCGLTNGSLMPEEIEEAEALVGERYAAREWTHELP
jgi:lipoate-protein ligase A